MRECLNVSEITQPLFDEEFDRLATLRKPEP